MRHDANGDVSVEITLRGPLMRTLLKHADRLQRQPVEVLADILEAVLGDDLVTAVLDE